MESFGKYLLLEKLAAGGMAEVYLAKSIGANGFNKFVAIKRILPQYSDNPEFVDMFKEEAKIAVNLNHSNIVSIYDFGIEKSQFFLVMEFVEGQNLRQILNHMKKENREFTPEQIIYLVKEVAAGLDHAHRCLDGTTGRPLNITHRDMSPQNVMISFEGEIKVVDFGIAKAETQMENTRAGTIKGKFGYMSPEQAEGNVVDPRTDVFSLGIVLWELLAKDRLFTGQNEAATLRKVRECQIPSLRKINPGISPELERICMKALAKDKSLRYQTAAAFHKDLNRFLNTQFPEFSTQEFSKYMKTLFHKMYLDNRRKLAEFAKLVFEPSSTPETHSDGNTQTETATEGQSMVGIAVGAQLNSRDSLDVAKSAGRVDLSALKSLDSKTPRPPSSPQGRTQTSTSTRPSTNTGIRPSSGTLSRISISTHQSSSSSLLVALTVLGLLGAGLAYYLKANPDRMPSQLSRWVKPATGTVSGASTSPTPRADSSLQTGDALPRSLVPINVQSNPQGAIVLINDQKVGITPYIGHIEANHHFRLSIRKSGYLPYDRTEEQTGKDLYRLEATLQPEPPMAYVAIEVVGGGPEPVVTVNGRRIDDLSQISRYPIPAGVPVVIKASNPFAQVSAEQTITVRQGERRPMRLILERQSQSHQ